MKPQLGLRVCLTEQGKQKTGKLRGSQVVGEERVAKQSGKVASVGDGIAMVDEFANSSLT